MICKLRMSENQYYEVRHRLSLSDPPQVLFGRCGVRAGSEIQVLCVRELVATEVSTPEFVASLRQGLNKNESPIIEFRRLPSSHDSKAPFRGNPSTTGSFFPAVRIMVADDGSLRGFWQVTPDIYQPLDIISVIGDDLQFWFSETVHDLDSSVLTLRVEQAFGKYTTDLLSRLSVAVIGCSGTGSIVVEQLARSGVGRLVLVDPDRVEQKNINRILNTFVTDGSIGRFKVDVLADAIARMGFDTEVEVIPNNLLTTRAVERVAECDVLFGCMDGAEGRFIANKLASFYSLPYIDVGVRLDADGHGGISHICGTVHYLKPGGSSLVSRGAITMNAVESEGLKRTNPEAYESQVKSKYIIGVQEDRPAVISVNMHYASLAVLELLARLHSFRVDGNAPYAQLGTVITDPCFAPVKSDGEPCAILAGHIGRGDTIPLLDSPYLSAVMEAK